MTRSTRSAVPAWRTPFVIGVVMLLAVAAGLALALTLPRSPGTGSESPSASASPSVPASGDTTTAPDASAAASQDPGASPPDAPGPTPVVAAPEGILPPGSIARVVTDGLRVRSEPSTGAPIVATLSTGEFVGVGFSYLHASWGPVEADGFSWYPVRPLETAELPPVPSQPFAPSENLGWVAFGDETEDFLELVPPRCVEGEPNLEILQNLLPWEQLACYGNRSIIIEGVFGCGGCGGMTPGTFEPGWLASPMIYDFVSVDPSERLGPMTVHFSPDGPERPEAGSILRITGHFDDPAASECSVAPGDRPQAVDDAVAGLYCRGRFVVESYEVLGTDEDFPVS